MLIEKIQFTYTPDITAVNRKQYEEHLKLYEGYVNKINEIDEILMKNPEYEKANATYSHFRGLKRGESFAMDGVILHELYFENLGGTSRQAEMLTVQTITQHFQGFDRWEKEFAATGKASRGWAVLIWDQRSTRLRNVSLDSHDEGNIALGFPLLVMDVYEHAYWGQYGADKAAYIEQFMKNINWQVVNRRFGRI